MTEQEVLLLRYTRPHPTNDQCLTLAADAPALEALGIQLWERCALGTALCCCADHRPKDGATSDPARFQLVKEAQRVLGLATTARDGCLIWVGSRMPIFDGAQCSPRRLAWLAHYGEYPPPYTRLRTTCGSRQCVSRAHLISSHLKTAEEVVTAQLRRQVEGYGDLDAHWLAPRDTVYDGTKTTGARRVVWETVTGEAYPGRVRAYCSEPRCLNPRHGSAYFRLVDVVDVTAQRVQVTSATSGLRRLTWQEAVRSWVWFVTLLTKHPPARPGEPYRDLPTKEERRTARQRRAGELGAIRQALTPAERAADDLAQAERVVHRDAVTARLQELERELQDLGRAPKVGRVPWARTLCDAYRAVLVERYRGC